MIIDHCYESVIKKLTAQDRINQISAELLEIKTNNERVFFVYNILKELDSFPIVQHVKKNAGLSTDYRNQGNKYYKNMDYFRAWQYYNLSLLYAPINSETYCLALSNRSIVLYYLNKYDECLKDISLVRSLKYPDDLKEKLATRENMCNKALSGKKSKQIETVPNKILQLQGERNAIYVCASSKLDVVHTKEMGRHVVANNDIKVGEVIAEEDPYFILLNKIQILFSCSYCLSRNLNLIPCENCCCALFCSEECKSRANKEYHQIECPLMATLLDMDFTKLELLALRMVIKSRYDHANWNSLFKTIEEAEKNMYTKLHGHVKVDEKWVYDSKYYAPHHTLATNFNKRSMSDVFQKALTAAVFFKFLSDNTSFLQSDDEDREKIKNCVAGSLFLHMMTSPTNMHAITADVGDKLGLFVEEVNIASGSYGFHSLLNHSCAPNVVRFSQLGTGTMKLFALRPIKKGMQIFDNYGMHHALADRMSRHKSLQHQYKFVCLCEACIENWPMYQSMGYSTIIPKQLINQKSKLVSDRVINSLQRGDLKMAVHIYDELCQLCEDLDKYAPCKELCECQESLKQCIIIFQGLIPYGHTQTVQWKAVP